MKFHNTTDFSNDFLKRMLRWVCRELGYPIKQMREARFTKTTRCSARGRAWTSRRILVRIGAASRFPRESWIYKGNATPKYEDQTEALIGVTSHEVANLCQFASGLTGFARKYKRLEVTTVGTEHIMLAAFRQDRDALLAAWSVPRAPRKGSLTTLSLVDRRAVKTQIMLAKWERKLKIARTKVKKLKVKANYYQRSAARRS